MTETGLSLGTPYYMSPEQATAEKEITGRSDVYSLATVLYEMLAGQPPAHGELGAADHHEDHRPTTPRPVTDLRKSVPPHVDAAVAQALEKLARGSVREPPRSSPIALSDQTVAGLAGGKDAAHPPVRHLTRSGRLARLARSAPGARWRHRRLGMAPSDPGADFHVSIPAPAGHHLLPESRAGPRSRPTGARWCSPRRATV